MAEGRGHSHTYFSHGNDMRCACGDVKGRSLPPTPLAVTCPKCSAEAGSRCRTTSGTGRTTDTHAARYGARWPENYHPSGRLRRPV